MTPNLVAIVGFVLLVATIEVQVRVVEEPYLLNEARRRPTATTSPTSAASYLELGSVARHLHIVRNRHALARF